MRGGGRGGGLQEERGHVNEGHGGGRDGRAGERFPRGGRDIHLTGQGGFAHEQYRERQDREDRLGDREGRPRERDDRSGDYCRHQERDGRGMERDSGR